MNTILSIQSQVAGARVGNSVAAFAMERLGVRVLQIPTPTWMAYDMVKYKLTLPQEIPLKHQERAYTSAIWYTPS